jgi:uncharacterized OB-fold protein
MRDQDFFWEGVKAGKLLFQKCSDCGAVRQPPGPMCPACQSLRWEPHEARGRGTVSAWILSRHPSQPDANPRIVGLIALEEGIRMISNLRDIELSKVTRDMPVEVFFDEVDGTVLPQFRPSAGAAA